MPLTTQQLTAIKAEIVADQVLNAFPNNPDGNTEIAAALNQAASPDFFVFETEASKSGIMNNGFDWTLVDNATVGKARIWEWLPEILDASKENIRAAINEAWSGGTGAMQAHRLSIFQHCQTLATRAEELLATGSGTTTSNAGVGPATRTFVGNLTRDDVEAARNLPD